MRALKYGHTEILWRQHKQRVVAGGKESIPHRTKGIVAGVKSNVPTRVLPKSCVIHNLSYLEFTPFTTKAVPAGGLHFRCETQDV